MSSMFELGPNDQMIPELTQYIEQPGDVQTELDFWFMEELRGPHREKILGSLALMTKTGNVPTYRGEVVLSAWQVHPGAFNTTIQWPERTGEQ
jgi:hypothetical protein